VTRAVTSLANPIVKLLRGLAQKKAREETGLLLAEGEKLVRDGIASGWPCRTLVLGEARAGEPAGRQLAAAVEEAGGQALVVSAAVLQKITRRDNPQTVVAAFGQRFGSLASLRAGGLWVALDRVRDPGNLGTIVRTADAAGCAGIVLVGATCDPFSPEAVRATMGSLFAVPLVRAEEAGFIEAARAAGMRLLGTHLAATVDYREADYGLPLVLVMGNEQQGLPASLAGACDTLVRIPMRPGADSLNLAVSTGLMIYEALRPCPA